MARTTLSLLGAVLVVSLGALSLPGAAPGGAKPSNDEIAAMKAKVKDLKAQIAALEEKIAAAEAPAAGAVPAFVTALNKLPMNLWPGDNDTDIKQGLRGKWLDENFKAGATHTLSGTVIVVGASTLYEGQKAIDGVRVVLDGGTYSVWGKDMGLRFIAEVANITPADTLDWGDKKVLTVTGPAKTYYFSGNPMEISLDNSKAK